MSGLKRYVKSSSGNGSRDVAIAVLQNDTSHTASTENVDARHAWYQIPAPRVVRRVEN